MNYRIIESFSKHSKSIWELQNEHIYIRNGKTINSWHIECCGTRKFCEEVLKRKIENHKVCFV